MTKKQVNICVIRGVEGPSLAINGLRVAGPKPWGGGEIISEWNVDEEWFLNDLRRLFPALAERRGEEKP